MTDYDPRIVALYDNDNPDGPDHAYVRRLADEVGARSIIDVGCGTGILTVTLARPGRRVVGVDPSAAMLAYARRRPEGDTVEWIHGDSQNIPPGPFDLAVMTGNVAQHIPDPQWQRTLADIHRALRDGGVLVLESRNPAVRAWETWVSSEPTTRQTAHGALREWNEIQLLGCGVVRLIAHNVFEDSGDHVVESDDLVFRDRKAIEEQLHEAGFTVDAVHGDWVDSAFTENSPFVIVRARRGSTKLPALAGPLRSEAAGVFTRQIP